MATIKEVAQLAGVGTGTVSRVISGNGHVSKKTLLKVNNAMNSLSYKPNSSAQSLRSRKFNTIGIWGTDTSGELNRSLLRDLENELRPYNVHSIIANGELNSNTNPNAARDSIESLINKGCDGIILWGADIDFPSLDILQIKRSFPNTVLLNNRIELINDNCFYFDHYNAGYIAGQHLIDMGHSSIACVTGWLKTVDANQRHQGFIDAMNDNNVNIPLELIVEGDYTYKKGYEGALTLLKQGIPFTALFCGNDQSAMATIYALSSKGYRVPQDISVMGYDDMNISAYTSPPLTTIKVPLNKMLVSSTRRLLNLCYNLNLKIDLDFTAQLVERKSVININ